MNIDLLLVVEIMLVWFGLKIVYGFIMLGMFLVLLYCIGCGLEKLRNDE